MPKGVYERKLKPLYPEQPPVATGPDSQPPDEDTVVISPTPRARPRPDDDRAAFNVRMRERAEAMYRRMKAGEIVVIGPDTVDVIQWMRGKGVRIRAVVSGGQTVYELVLAPALALAEGEVRVTGSGEVHVEARDAGG